MALVVALVLALLWVTPVFAEMPESNGPFDAMAPTSEWQTLNQEQYHWYVFHFDYVDDETVKPIEIKMLAEPYNSATLTIRNQDQIDEWVRDGTHMHFGCTTMVNEDADHNGYSDYQQWAGALRESGKYYLVVEHARDVVEPAHYQFTVKGENIFFPTEEVGVETAVSEMMADAETEPLPAMATQSVASNPEPQVPVEWIGTGPDFAMAPTGEWTPLENETYHWYKINVDTDDDFTEPMTIRLYTEPEDSAILTIRNGYQAELWRQDGSHDHFGCCVEPTITSQVETDDEDEEDGLIEETKELGYAIWSGDMTESGVYYLVVEHARNMDETAFYRFDITGQGLDF